MALKVTHFILDHRLGGPHVYVQTLSLALASDVQSTIVTAGRGPITQVAMLNLRRWFRPLYLLEVPLNAIFIIVRFGLFCRPSLFHVHGAANIAPLLAAFFCRMPVVWHFHETVTAQRSLARLGSWLIRFIRHRVVTVAPTARTVFGHPNAVLALGAVDVKFWNPEMAHSSTNFQAALGSALGSKSLRILAVANLNPLKGLDTLVDALPLAELPVNLDIIGAELDTHVSYIRTIKKRVADAITAHPEISVRFLGKQSATSIRTCLAGCDVFVLPSRSEACPIALLEAMAMARPVIATDVGAVRKVLPAAQHAFICAPDCPRELASAINKMGRVQSNERERLGQGNRLAVESNFTPARLAKDIFNCYTSLLTSDFKDIDDRLGSSRPD